MKRRRIQYKDEYPHLLYTYFVTYEDTFGAPSFSKFARSIGATLEDVERFRKHKRFDVAYRECKEIRRDYLIDHALVKRFDSSFTKFLLALEYPEDAGEDKELAVRLEVLED
jgi:hypothetical protein